MDAKLGRNNKRSVRRAMALTHTRKNNESKKNVTITKEQQMNETSRHQHKKEKKKRDQNERVAKSTAATTTTALALNVICTFHIYTKYTCVACRFSLPFTAVTIELDVRRRCRSTIFHGTLFRLRLRECVRQTEWLAAWQTVGSISGTSKQ